ncbi:MAG: hypothetical protein QF921_05980 [Pseudomonadales bacterium]|jgi:hypothetical protein|nr:hypothetical protein [Pseudomonadales bacterium]MDP6470053.1 hypothetical protein [Pseudomonadales bacterium]MDP6826956.1 hypothetical protein [Pseudomonadales bacterium]MDP6971051.1 hypothetical protein [Pseudomonadales bacterium]|tara:strand:+ start:762 stop:1295 length:534 start_codon:yes stop_codon:yes gene_type:complete
MEGKGERAGEREKDGAFLLEDQVHHKGREATANPASRFLLTRSVRTPDGWDLPEEPDSAPQTRFYADTTVRIITRNRSPDVPFDRSINAYKGCEHGCVYCFARPTYAYLDLLTGLAERGLVNVMVSITTLDNRLKTLLEPRTASPAARLRNVSALAGAGVPVGVLAAPSFRSSTTHR